MAGSGAGHLRDGAILSVDHLVVEFTAPRGGTVHAVSDVSFDVVEGETVGLVGESGCGKSTTARAIVRHVTPTAGAVRFEGVDLATLSREQLRRTRTRLQMIFQDPISSLNPRRTVERIVGEGLQIWKVGERQGRAEKVREVMEAVGLYYDPAARRRPSEFSGGQCQRISIARSLVLDPKVVVCDEPVSALDVSVQAQILNLLVDMRERYALTLVFIAHDLAVVKHVSDRIIVMYLGKICEIAEPSALYRNPAHHYTATLLDAIPVPEPSGRHSPRSTAGTVEAPSALHPPSGCRFRTRCLRAEQRCADEEPELRAVGVNHFVACHFPLSTAHAEGSS